MTTIERAPIDTGTDELLAERDGAVLILTLNRPERLNAISGPMLATLSRLLIEANRDPEVRVVILTGAGRGFCSGLDLVENGARRPLRPRSRCPAAVRPPRFGADRPLEHG